MTVNKKAMMMHYLVLAVLLVIVLVVVLPLLSSIKAASERAGMRVACEESLKGQQQLKLFSGGLASKSGSPAIVNCATEYLTINSEGEEFLREISDHMYDCFSLYDKKYDLFNQETGTYCIICKKIEIEKDQTAEGLIDFLKAAYIPAKDVAIKTTYLAAFGGSGALELGADHYYNYYNFKKNESIALIITYGTKGFTGERIILKDKVGLGMLIHPYDKVGELGCYSFEGKTNSLEYKGTKLS